MSERGDHPPPEIERLAERRAEARRRRDFASADELKAAIEAAGWKVVDAGHDYRLEPALPADIEVGGRLRYGASASVPSRLDEPATARGTLVLACGDEPERVERSMAAIDGGPGSGGQVVVVADGPIRAVEERLDAWAARAEIVALAERATLGACWNAGLRRAVGDVAVLVDRETDVAGDVLSPMIKALADETIAVVGAVGLSSSDVRHWLPDGGPEVDAVDAACLGFRRSDFVHRGPLDERFAAPRLLAAWWSLVLRDEGEGVIPRRALAVGLPVVSAGRSASAAGPPADRAERRDRYRIIDRFGRRYDLLRAPVRPRAAGSRGRRR